MILPTSSKNKILWEKLKIISNRSPPPPKKWPCEITSRFLRGRETRKAAGYVGVFKQNLSITAYTLENYSSFKSKFLFFWDFMILLDSFYDFWENEALFVKIGARVLHLWLDTSFRPKWPKYSFWVPDHKVKKSLEISWFWSYDSCENEALFVEIEARVLDLQLDVSSGSKWPRCSF